MTPTLSPPLDEAPATRRRVRFDSKPQIPETILGGSRTAQTGQHKIVSKANVTHRLTPSNLKLLAEENLHVSQHHLTRPTTTFLPGFYMCPTLIPNARTPFPFATRGNSASLPPIPPPRRINQTTSAHSRPLIGARIPSHSSCTSKVTDTSATRRNERSFSHEVIPPLGKVTSNYAMKTPTSANASEPKLRHSQHLGPLSLNEYSAYSSEEESEASSESSSSDEDPWSADSHRRLEERLLPRQVEPERLDTSSDPISVDSGDHSSSTDSNSPSHTESTSASTADSDLSDPQLVEHIDREDVNSPGEPVPSDAIETPAKSYFTLTLFLSDPSRLSSLLQHLAFSDWCNLFSVSKEIRSMLEQNELLREEVLERYLKDVGYSRWVWRESEALSLSLLDLRHYMRAASTSTSEYRKVAESYLVSKSERQREKDPLLSENVWRLSKATRAYSRVVLRLRTQAEASSSTTDSAETRPSSASSSRRSSRHSTPFPSTFSSPTASFLSGDRRPRHSDSSSFITPIDVPSFHSPLYRPRRAALLRVFVPSPKEWLSDESVLECEAELRRAGITSSIRLGDVVWDVAVGEEDGNVGRLIWDGSYLIDLDYTYSSTGDIPRHIPSLAFPPSYFHGVIRHGPLNANPIMRIDVSPWGHEISRNLQLMQDRMVATTSHGTLQKVVKWVHRSTFTIRPPSRSNGIPIPNVNGGQCYTVHPAWYGAIIIETDGSNESLEDLKERCGTKFFPKLTSTRKPGDTSEKTVWRLIREKSRPGEIWIRLVGPRERRM
ncbi:hypothetical protein VNI00_005312 [Paramarasmius palmivorus]|uniref:F-box domain-containing protein n=1 Tax=Paramarasmius palmivorus TaxID=297713 RepID=A0AAW0DDE0_9AGAR